LKKIICLLFFFVSVFILKAQEFNYSKFFVVLKDKNNSPYSISNSNEYLSQRAIERRERYGIAIDENDIPVTPDYINFIKGVGATVLNTSKWFNAVSIQLEDTSLLQTIRQFSFVKSIEPVYGTRIQHIEDVNAKTAIVRISETDSHIDYGNGYNQIAMLKADYLHHNGFKGDDIFIAVLDAGFRNAQIISAFDSMFQNGRMLGTWDFVTNQDSVFGSDSHGTNVLSAMASNIPGSFIGTAPNASYFLLRTEDAPTEFRIEEDNWTAAAEFADSAGADIINSSLGYSDFDDSTMTYTYADMNGKTTRISQAATIASRKGMIVVNSAGNSGNNSWRYITAPADADSILAIGATDANGVATNFSSRGPSVDGRVKPDVMGQGRATTIVNTSGQVTSGNGTSFSSPVMAGAVACFWQAHREKSNIEIINIIRQSAHLYNNPNDSMGYGIPDFRAAHIKLLREKGKIYQQEFLPIAYPNPFSEQLNVMVHALTDETIEVVLYDGMGKILFSENRNIVTGSFENFHIQGTDGLNAGVYFVRIKSEILNKTLRVVKF
jgi:serine protease AprX